MTLPEFTFVQSSQWLPASPQVLEQGTDSVLHKNPDIVAFTEIYTKERSARLAEHGFGSQQKPGTDPGIDWLKANWKSLHAETVQVSSLTYYSVLQKHETRPMAAAFVVLENQESGHRLLTIANHFPPHVEGHGGPGGIFDPSMAPRWHATIDSIKGIQAHRRLLRKEYDIDALILTADWNLNIMRGDVRAWVHTQFPYLEPNFKPSYKGAGTLDKRVVDFSVVHGLEVVGDPKVNHIVSSDHRTVTTKLRFVNPPHTKT